MQYVIYIAGIAHILVLLEILSDHFAKARENTARWTKMSKSSDCSDVNINTVRVYCQNYQYKSCRYVLKIALL